MPLRGRASSGPHDNDLRPPCGKLCEVTPAASGEVLFLKSPTSFTCHQKVGFGNGEVCTCPVRRRIFEEHGT